MMRVARSHALIGFECLPLHEAVHLGRSDEVALLIKAGAGVNEKDAFGSTPLHVASWVGNDAAVSALLAQGACTDARRFDDLTPLALAKLRVVDLDDDPLPEGLTETALLCGNWQRVFKLLLAAPGQVDKDEDLGAMDMETQLLEFNRLSWNSISTASTCAPEDEGTDVVRCWASSPTSDITRSLKDLAWTPELTMPQNASWTT